MTELMVNGKGRARGAPDGVTQLNLSPAQPLSCGLDEGRHSALAELGFADRTLDVRDHDRTSDGESAVTGIERKLTEPFSQRTYGANDHHTVTYRTVGRRSSVWIDPMADSLTDKRWNQLRRNHLVESIRQTEPRVRGCEIMVHHPLDSRFTESIAGYAAHLVAPNESLRLLTLDTIVATWADLISTKVDRRWLADFADRYLNLELSGS